MHYRPAGAVSADGVCSLSFCRVFVESRQSGRSLSVLQSVSKISFWDKHHVSVYSNKLTGSVSCAVF